MSQEPEKAWYGIYKDTQKRIEEFKEKYPDIHVDHVVNRGIWESLEKEEGRQKKHELAR